MMNKLKNTFEDIYKNEKWNNKNKNVPLSGPGSTTQIAQKFTNFIEKFIYENNIKNIIDIGCGDLTWISKTKFFNDEKINYIGMDISEYIININKLKYSNKKFEVNNVIEKFDYQCELIILRDVIFHLLNTDIITIFSNIKNKFNYICITNCRTDVNLDIFDKWHFSQKNIHIEPFNICNNYLHKIEENKFNRDILLFEHDVFYKNLL